MRVNVTKITYNRGENGTVKTRRNMDTMMCFRNSKLEGTLALNFLKGFSI